MARPLAIFWDHSVGGNVDHLGEHGVSVEEAEQVIGACSADRQRSRSTPEYWAVRGFTRNGRFLLVVFEYVQREEVVIPVTAFEPEGI